MGIKCTDKLVRLDDFKGTDKLVGEWDWSKTRIFSLYIHVFLSQPTITWDSECE